MSEGCPTCVFESVCKREARLADAGCESWKAMPSRMSEERLASLVRVVRSKTEARYRKQSHAALFRQEAVEAIAAERTHAATLQARLDAAVEIIAIKVIGRPRHGERIYDKWRAEFDAEIAATLAAAQQIEEGTR